MRTGLDAGVMAKDAFGLHQRGLAAASLEADDAAVAVLRQCQPSRGTEHQPFDRGSAPPNGALPV